MKRQISFFDKRKLRYSLLQNNTYLINFSPYVSSDIFEDILKECYWRSKSSVVESVEFNLRNVRFLDIFELGLAALWLLELKKKKKVEVKFPFPDSSVYYFLTEYAFEEFLSKNNIRVDKFGPSPKKPYTNMEQAEFVPLKFAFEDVFQKYLNRLSVEKEREPVLDSMKGFEVVSGGALRSVVVKELKDNIQSYADNSLPYLIMTKFVMGKNENEKARFLDILRARAQKDVEWERSFFHSLLRLYSQRELKQLTYFELVIGDGGPGIQNTLGKIEECREKKEQEVLDYAFYYDSTSDPERRWKSIRKWARLIAEEYEEFPPATGLYWVKQIAKKYSGFLSIRSGKTILCYDFLTYPTEGRPESRLITNRTWQFQKMKGLRNLSSFKGVHYKIYFPLHYPLYFLRKKYFEVSRKELHGFPLFKYSVVSLKDYFLTAKDPDEQWKSLENLVFNDIRTKVGLLKRDGSHRSRGIILVDFDDIGPGSLLRKVLHYLVVEMMRRQDSNLAIVSVNVGESIFSEMEIIASKVIDPKQYREHGKERPLILLKENLEVGFLGTTYEEQKVLRSALEQDVRSTDVTKNELAIINANDHIMDYDSTEGKYYLCFPYEQVVSKLEENLRNGLRSVILDESNSIFHPHARVNLPNRYHVEGFFEIWKLIENRGWKSKLRKWVDYNLKLLNPTVVITVGTPCQDLMRSISIKNVKWLSIISPLSRLPLAELITLEREDRILILSDVIGTGESLDKILTFVSSRDILKILVIIDAREKKSSARTEEYKYEGFRYRLESIVTQPLSFYKKGKPGDWDYDTIKLLEPSTFALIAESIKPAEEPLWLKIGIRRHMVGKDKVQDFVNPFIDQVVGPSDSVVIGHFGTKSNKHMTFLFLVPQIADRYARQIATVIGKDIQKIREKSGRELNVTHILYPRYNPGLETIVSRVSEAVGGSPQPVSNDEIFNISTERRWRFGKIEAAVILDDSFSSGGTLKRLIDISYEAGAEFAFVYTLMNRSDHFNTRFLTNLPLYGRGNKQIGLRISHLVDAQIPMFSASDCPICRYVEKLKSIRREVESELCRVSLGNEISKWPLENVQLLGQESILRNYLSIEKKERVAKCNLRWKLEIAREELGARNELARIVRDYETKQKQVLNLFEVLRHEILYFFGTYKEKFNDVFYFRDEIKDACESYATNFEVLSKHVGSLILVWYFVHPESLLDAMERILDSLKEDRILLGEAIAFVLIGDNLTEGKYRHRLIDVFSSFLAKIDNVNLNWEFGKVLQYLYRKKGEELVPSFLCKNYRHAMTGVYLFDGELQNIHMSIQGAAEEKAIESFERIINETPRMLHGVETILESNLMTPREQWQLMERYEGLIQVKEDFSRLLAMNALGVKELRDLVERFQLTVQRVRTILSVFRCDLTNSVESFLKSNKAREIVDRYNISVNVAPGEKNYFGFIREDPHIRRILEESFKNLKWAFSGRPDKSHRNKVRISLKPVPPSEDFLCLEILDNGNPSGGRTGQGHFLIKSLAEEWGGKFEPIKKIAPNEEFGKEGFTKRSSLYLENLPPPQDKKR